MTPKTIDEKRMIIRLAEYCELLSKRIEVLEETVRLRKGKSECKVYHMNISHMNQEENKSRAA